MKTTTFAIVFATAALALCGCGKRTVCRCIDTDSNYTVLTDITECPDIKSCDELPLADTTLFDCTVQ